MSFLENIRGASSNIFPNKEINNSQRKYKFMADGLQNVHHKRERKRVIWSDLDFNTWTTVQRYSIGK